MSIWNKLRGELVDIIEFLDDTGNTLVYRFQRYDNEIKHGAKLVCREGQAACFVNEGQLADIFRPGTYTLETKNLPILATLKGWKYGFSSPFKAEVYFVSTRTFTDQKWGTQNPIMVRDPEFGPVRLRAFGTYTFRVVEPGAFLKNVVGTDGRFTVEGINNQLRNLIVSEFADALGTSKVPMLDLAANYRELGELLGRSMAEDFAKFGIEVPMLRIENISLPPEVEQALDKRSSMGVIGNLDAYTKFSAAEAMRDLANNPGGGTAGTVVGLGMGQVLAGSMGGAAMNPGAGSGGGGGVAGPGAPPPIPGAANASPFFLAINGQQHGPFELGLLSGKAASGELKKDTLVWRQGMAAWTPAGSVPELAAVFAASTPPPLPPV